MSHTPSTIRGESGGTPGVDWTATAALHRSNDGGGLLEDLKAVRHGSLADLVRYVALLSAEARAQYEIEVPGNRRFAAAEIMELYARDDFPHAS